MRSERSYAWLFCMIGGGGTRGANISQYLASQPQSNHRRPLTTLHTITATSLSLALCTSLTPLPVFTSNPATWTLMMGWKLQGNKILLVSAVTGHISVFQSICPQSGLKLRSWGIESTRTEQSGTCSEADYFWLRRRDNGKYEEQNMYRLLRCRG